LDLKCSRRGGISDTLFEFASQERENTLVSVRINGPFYNRKFLELRSKQNLNIHTQAFLKIT